MPYTMCVMPSSNHGQKLLWKWPIQSWPVPPVEHLHKYRINCHYLLTSQKGGFLQIRPKHIPEQFLVLLNSIWTTCTFTCTHVVTIETECKISTVHTLWFHKPVPRSGWSWHRVHRSSIWVEPGMEWWRMWYRAYVYNVHTTYPFIDIWQWVELVLSIFQSL